MNPFASLLQRQQQEDQVRSGVGKERGVNNIISSSSSFSSSPHRKITTRKRLCQDKTDEEEQMSAMTSPPSTLSESSVLSTASRQQQDLGSCRSSDGSGSGGSSRRRTRQHFDDEQQAFSSSMGSRRGHFESAEARPSRWTTSKMSSTTNTTNNNSKMKKRKLTRYSLDSFNSKHNLLTSHHKVPNSTSIGSCSRNSSSSSRSRGHSLNMMSQQEEGQSNGLRLSDVLTQVTRLVQQEEEEDQMNNSATISTNEDHTTVVADAIEDTLQNVLEEPYEPHFFSPPPSKSFKGHRKKTTASMELTNQLKKIKGPLGSILLKAASIDQRERTLLWSMKKNQVEKEMLLFTQRPYVIVCLQKQYHYQQQQQQQQQQVSSSSSMNNHSSSFQMSTSKGMTFFEATIENIKLIQQVMDNDNDKDRNDDVLTNQATIKYQATIDSYQQMMRMNTKIESDSEKSENDGRLFTDPSILKRRVMVVFTNQIVSTLELKVLKKIQIFAPFFFIPISLEERQMDMDNDENCCPLYYLMGTNQSRLV
jgi:hypothetical protein